MSHFSSDLFGVVISLLGKKERKEKKIKKIPREKK